MIRRLGSYVLLMIEAFKRPDKGRVFRKQLLYELQSLGLESMGIVFFISVFTGGILALQTAYNIDNPFIPLYTDITGCAYIYVYLFIRHYLKELPPMMPVTGQSVINNDRGIAVTKKANVSIRPDLSNNCF